MGFKKYPFENRLSRREFIGRGGSLAAVLGIGMLTGPLTVSAASDALSRIGIIGAGRIGSAVGLRWAIAGHEVFFSSRNPDELAALVEEAGSLAQAGLPADAAAFGDVVAIATPYDALPQLGRDYAAGIRGKVVIVLSNPARQNGGDASQDAIARGWGVVTPELLPGARVVRAFNAINFRSVASEANRAGEKVGVPLAGDDGEALRVASALIVDAGFDPVLVGGLERADDFGPGSAVFASNMTAAQIREALNL